MRFLVGLGLHVEDRAKVSAVRASDGCVVVEVTFALAEEKHVFVTARRSISHALGLAVGLVPDEIGSEIPSSGLESEGQSPRDSNQILRLETVWSGRPHVHGPHGILL